MNAEEKMDLSGRRCLVTGATSGHGKAVARILAGMGADVMILGRNPGKCRSAADEISSSTGRKTEMLLCDFSSQKDIRRAASEFMSLKKPLHILVNNAGQVNRGFSKTEDGYESTFAVNYLAMFQFTILIMRSLVSGSPSRIINVSSDTHRIVRLNPDDLEGRKGSFSLMGSYGRSKLAIVHFTLELAERLHGTGVTVNAVDPGPVASGIADKPGIIPQMADAIIQLTFPKPEKAARTAIYLATSPEMEGLTGGYYRFMKKKTPRLSPDPDFGKLLWKKSLAMTGTGDIDIERLN
ncbi:MAG: SDR family NAD(P)-dependent oxidoreductase [Spirochaetes bacterium]|jgi:NAD(P)-dependent dehydrogenase (short-subunit alcohol dehydrogenase family)|nr:SDR family NAD(P)-dependent oxidoreductase [Spirochaetota bacterium]